MRKLIYIAPIILLCMAFSMPAAKTKGGITFFKGGFQKALKESELTGKPIFIDFYADWCGPCKQLKRTTFRDSEVAAYFNKNFINLAIDGESAEGAELMRIYKVNSYPTLLIVDKKGKLLAKTTGFMKPYILINFGRRVIP